MKASQEPPPKVANATWLATSAGGTADVIVYSQGHADTSAARYHFDKDVKTRYVFNTLTRYSSIAQAGLRRELDSRHISYNVLWLINAIAVPAMDRTTLLWLSSRADVDRIDLDEKTQGIQIDAQKRGQNSSSQLQTLFHLDTSPQTIEANVGQVHAPQVWAGGDTGQGIVVADLDTGVLYNHPALLSKYRGWNGITSVHDYSWYDTITGSLGSPNMPIDPYGHGTHTMGIMVGDDGFGNQVGVAPGAKWIACRNMDSTGVGSVSRYVMCFQFAMAPTKTDGTQPDPAKAADITSNSWVCDSNYAEVGCSDPTALITSTQALHDAGIMVVAAAGNSGCGGITLAPGTLNQAFTVGAVDGSNNIASFSGVGPSSLTGKLKPNVVAPGVSIRSSTHDGLYGYQTGTSMATPHVAGVAALLWSAAPWLRGNVDETTAIMTSTAQALTGTDCGISGSSIPNDIYGYGLIDAQAALSETRALVPRIDMPATQAQTQPLAITYTLTNASQMTRKNVTLTATIPLSASVLSISSGGVQTGQQITWSFGDLSPAQRVVLNVVVTPNTVGWVNSNATVAYDGIVMRRIVPGATASSFISAYQLRLIVVQRG
ncbi:MAG TPA: S8 family serine peptidase [Anaerolineae bacterium]